MKRQRRTLGSFVKVPLDSEYHTYARILEDTCFAFYDYKTKNDEDNLVNILNSNILFIIPVYDSAVKNGRWKKIGTIALEEQLQGLPLFFMQDDLDPNKFSIYEKGEIRPATKEECEGLECAAVWEAEHVEERLRDHYANRPNEWVESLKIK